MSVSIRLRREGSLNNPYYKVVVADSRSPRDGKFIEIIGTYDPTKPGHNSTLKLDRIEYWVSKGAQPSDTVRSLIKKNKEQAAKPVAEKMPAEPVRPEAPPPAPAPDETAPPVSVPAESAPTPPSAESGETSAS
jgi:small subunit ribosomal protein S16